MPARSSTRCTVRREMSRSIAIREIVSPAWYCSHTLRCSAFESFEATPNRTPFCRASALPSADRSLMIAPLERGDRPHDVELQALDCGIAAAERQGLLVEVHDGAALGDVADDRVKVAEDPARAGRSSARAPRRRRAGARASPRALDGCGCRRRACPRKLGQRRRPQAAAPCSAPASRRAGTRFAAPCPALVSTRCADYLEGVAAGANALLFEPKSLIRAPRRRVCGNPDLRTALLRVLPGRCSGTVQHLNRGRDQDAKTASQSAPQPPHPFAAAAAAPRPPPPSRRADGARSGAGGGSTT